MLFPHQADGSLITVHGANKTDGSELIGQAYSDDGHMWGRIMQPDMATYHDRMGHPLFYAGPSNLSPASDEFKKLVAARVAKLRAADPEMGQPPAARAWEGFGVS